MVDLGSEDFKERTLKCSDMIQELFVINKIPIPIASSAMFSLIVSLSVAFNEPFEVFEERMLIGIQKAKEIWDEQ